MELMRIYIPSLRGESNDRREFDSPKQSLEIALNLRGLLRQIILLRRMIFLAMTVLVAFAGCDSPIASDYQEQIVVGAFIYSGAPIDSVVLHRTTPLGQYYDDTDYAVTDAQVTVTVDGVVHTLKPLAEKGRYYLPASELIVQGGKTYNLSITAPNLQSGGTHNISASTTVPMPIHLSGIADSIHGLSFTLDTNNLSTFAFLVTATTTDQSDDHFLLSVTALDTSKGRTGF